jgi:hypothetical protein
MSAGGGDRAAGMKITWHCAKCGSLGSSESRATVSSTNEGRLARMLHDSVSPNCHPQQGDIDVRFQEREATR